MPIYVYECETCGKVTERIMSLIVARHKVGTLIECEGCGGVARQVVTGHAKTPTKWMV